MNKAFTKEDASSEDEEEIVRSVPTGKNYITPIGLQRLQSEFKELKFKIRPEITKTVSWAAENGDRSENGDYLYGKKKLREIDRRLRFLSKRVEAAEVIDPTSVRTDQVQFGATVTIRNEDDSEKTYSIVGVDEIDIAKGRISWLSPIASALMKARIGDVVTFRSPKGSQEIEIIDIKYVAID